MSSLHLLLPLHTATAQTEFQYVLTPDGRVAARQASAPASLLPQPTGAGREVVAIVPATALSWHQVELPKGTTGRSPRLRAVLEGLLEDKLLDEPENLHFALAPNAPATGPVWVAVCDRAWLRAALQVLESAGRQVGRVVPEFAPEGDPTLFAVGEPDDARLVCASRDGVLLLPLAATSLALLPALADSTTVIAEPAVAELAEQLLRPPALLPPAERRLQAGRTAWDLAQMEFANSGRTRAFKKLSLGWGGLLRAPEWRAARWGVLVLVIAQLIGLNSWAYRERSALALKRDASRSILTQTFPSVRVVVDPPLQMQREVAALRQVSGNVTAADLETMLGAVAATVPAGRAATAVEYGAGELRLRGLVAAAAEAQPMQASLRSLGYAAEVKGDQLVLKPGTAP